MGMKLETIKIRSVKKVVKQFFIFMTHFPVVLFWNYKYIDIVQSNQDEKDI